MHICYNIFGTSNDLKHKDFRAFSFLYRLLFIGYQPSKSDMSVIKKLILGGLLRNVCKYVES